MCLFPTHALDLHMPGRSEHQQDLAHFLAGQQAREAAMQPLGGADDQRSRQLVAAQIGGHLGVGKQTHIRGRAEQIAASGQIDQFSR